MYSTVLLRSALVILSGHSACHTLVTSLNEGDIVLDPGMGVCADPVNGGAILGKGGPDLQGGNKERQLNPDKGRGKT
jgi:hypothetical protein